ncbi:MAG: CHRD domain-containing protein, partial [Nitrososphaeraceae archaeon]|nr:CHRD domain-containing protein [Nitrososphaeraceae archaeon]
MTLIVVSITLLSLVIVATVSGETFFIYAQNQTKYAAKLIGKSVVPPVNTTAAGRAIFFIANDWLRWKLNVTGITDPTHAHIHMGERGTNGVILADLLILLKSPKIEQTTERTIISGNISAYDLQGPMKGKTFADLQSAIKAVGVYVDLHTKSHPDGELRGTIKIQSGNTTTQIASKNNTDDVNSFKNKDSNSTVPTKATSTTTTDLATTTDTISTFGNPNENNLVDELVKTGNFTEAEAREFVTSDMQSENGTDTTSDTNTTSNVDTNPADTNTTSNADTNPADTNTTSNADTNPADTNTTSNADTNTGNRSKSDDTSSTNNEDNNDQSSNNNSNNPRHYDDLDKLVNDIKNSDVDSEEISLNAFQDSGAYQGADQETRDCIDLAGKIGHNLGDQEIVNCSEDPSFYKNEISNNNDNNND